MTLEILELLHKLLPYEISKHAIENLETRLGDDGESADVQRLSDHRALWIHRGILKANQSGESGDNKVLANFSASCRLGKGTLVLGQLCLRETNSTVLNKDLELSKLELF